MEFYLLKWCVYFILWLCLWSHLDVLGGIGLHFLISGSFKMTERVSGASNVMVTIVSPVVIGSKTKRGV